MTVQLEETLTQLREALPTLQQQFGVKELHLFGSVARSEATEASDVDVLVEFDADATFDAYMGVRGLLEERLDARVDLVTRAALKSMLREHVLSEAVRVA